MVPILRVRSDAGGMRTNSATITASLAVLLMEGAMVSEQSIDSVGSRYRAGYIDYQRSSSRNDVPSGQQTKSTAATAPLHRCSHN